MSKRALLWLLAGIALTVAYLIAAGASEDIGSHSECVGLASFPNWFDSLCEAVLVPRIMMILVIGAIPASVLVYFAEKDAEPRSNMVTSLLAFAKSSADDVVLEYHEVEWSSDNSRYHCVDCGFETADNEEAETHRWQEAHSAADNQ